MNWRSSRFGSDSKLANKQDKERSEKCLVAVSALASLVGSCEDAGRRRGWKNKAYTHVLGRVQVHLVLLPSKSEWFVEFCVSVACEKAHIGGRVLRCEKSLPSQTKVAAAMLVSHSGIGLVCSKLMAMQSSS